MFAPPFTGLGVSAFHALAALSIVAGCAAPPLPGLPAPAAVLAEVAPTRWEPLDRYLIPGDLTHADPAILARCMGGEDVRSRLPARYAVVEVSHEGLRIGDVIAPWSSGTPVEPTGPVLDELGEALRAAAGMPEGSCWDPARSWDPDAPGPHLLVIADRDAPDQFVRAAVAALSERWLTGAATSWDLLVADPSAGVPDVPRRLPPDERWALAHPPTGTTLWGAPTWMPRPWAADDERLGQALEEEHPPCEDTLSLALDDGRVRAFVGDVWYGALVNPIQESAGWAFDDDAILRGLTELTGPQPGGLHAAYTHVRIFPLLGGGKFGEFAHLVSAVSRSVGVIPDFAASPDEDGVAPPPPRPPSTTIWPSSRVVPVLQVQIRPWTDSASGDSRCVNARGDLHFPWHGAWRWNVEASSTNGESVRLQGWARRAFSECGGHERDTLKGASVAIRLARAGTPVLGATVGVEPNVSACMLNEVARWRLPGSVPAINLRITPPAPMSLDRGGGF